MNVNVVFVLCMTALAAVDANPATPLIVGGVYAKAGDIPWIVSLSARQWGYKHFCGGSLLDKNTILTAAHCVKGLKLSTDGLKARIGSLSHNNGGKQYKVDEIRMNSDYNTSTVTNDVAILKVNTDMIVSGNINSIPVSTVQLPTGGELDAGTVVKAAGWGYYKPDGGPLSDKLKWVEMPMVERGVCNSPTEYNGGITNEMVCAGEPGEDSCSGDSGGPLTYGNVIYGIVSWGIFPCADSVKPGVYSNVVALLGWINANKG